jgi:phosphoglycerate dehydrogenase-like enzyme
VVAGFGPVGRHVARLLDALGLRVSVLRRAGGTAVDESHTWPAHPYEHIDALLPQADWLVLACPLSDRTRSLLNARRMACMPRGARIVNVARGEVVDEAALIAALLDVFAYEPLPADSPLWSLPNVIATPHTAGHSDGNATRVAQMFLDNLARWLCDEPLAQRIGSG